MGEDWLTREQYERLFCDVETSQQSTHEAPTQTAPEPFSIRSPEADPESGSGLLARFRSRSRPKR